MNPNIDEAIKRMTKAIAELGDAVEALDVTNPTENEVAETCTTAIRIMHRRIRFIRLDIRRRALFGDPNKN